MAEPESHENPHRRILVGTIVGVLIAALVVAGFAVYGLLRPGGASSWRKPGALVVEKETGSRYILIGGALRPVLNYASAVLLLGEEPEIVSVSEASLRSVPRGLPVGIVGAPDALPGETALAGVAWTVCAVARRDQAGALFTATTLTVDRVPAAQPLDETHGVVARSTSGQAFLVWRGRRFALTHEWLARGLGYDGEPTVVEPGWMEQLPAGSDIAPIRVPGRGEPGPVIDGQPTTIGQIFVARVPGTAERYFVLQKDGLGQLSTTGYAVLSSDPETAQAYGTRSVKPIELTAAALTALPISKLPTLPADLPEVPPAPATIGPDRTWCVRRDPTRSEPMMTAEPLPAQAMPVRDGIGVTRTTRTASAISVAAGVGGLVLLGRPGQASGSSYLLVTDAGVKYPFPGVSAVEALGYSLEHAAVVPPTLLALLPTGPLLDPNQVRG